ncbi:hypothetical protein [Acidaminococcus fermentans]|uniref:hypothetical protein n=1 Tax=Acidaminococcus fermentans TaxID=905 RepID=UPI0008E58047|nr:hypothetical protein [Acidaminococcus fermentans]MDD6286842.1 hypothetical protein [Acidaminococcus fermentans]SFO54224.1 hypothetical protein SAMN02910455_00905 [Acidaminococcus fermentans]
MEEAMREQVRAFAARGLESLEQEDLPDARGNLVLTCEALRDRKGAETCCSREEMEALDRVLRELEAFPKLAANAGDSLLDLEGVRCYGAGRFLIFYRYNSNYGLVTVIRLALDHPEWNGLIRDGKKFR